MSRLSSTEIRVGPKPGFPSAKSHDPRLDVRRDLVGHPGGAGAPAAARSPGRNARASGASGTRWKGMHPDGAARSSDVVQPPRESEQ
jgi:hypothetical protein